MLRLRDILPGGCHLFFEFRSRPWDTNAWIPGRARELGPCGIFNAAAHPRSDAFQALLHVGRGLPPRLNIGEPPTKAASFVLLVADQRALGFAVLAHGRDHGSVAPRAIL